MVCCVAPEAGMPHRGYIDKKKESIIIISEISYLIGTKLAAELPTS